MSKWQAIVFDLDDTLYPESRYVLSGFRAVADWLCPQIGVDCQSGYAELATMFHAGVRGDTFNRWLSSYRLPAEDWLKQLVEVYRDHTPQITPFPEIPELLPQLCQRAHLGLISDGYLTVQQKKWDALGLTSYFSAVVFSDQFGKDYWKPSPKPFLAVQEVLGADPARAVYIADNPKKDFLGARRAGWRSIWFRHSEGEYTHLEPESPAHCADCTIMSLGELMAALDTII